MTFLTSADLSSVSAGHASPGDTIRALPDDVIGLADEPIRNRLDERQVLEYVAVWNRAVGAICWLIIVVDYWLSNVSEYNVVIESKQQLF